MALPEDARSRLSHRLTLWCSTRVPAPDRSRRQIGYTLHGNEITIVDRRAPLYPELEIAWSTVPLVRLRLEDAGAWTLYQWAGRTEAWQRTGDPGDDPIALLDRYAA